MADIYANFIENLRDLMSENNLSVKELAEKVGVYESTLYNYLRGSRRPDLNVLIRLADRFSCSTDYLLGRAAEYEKVAYRACPPFSERLRFLIEHSGVNKYRLCKEASVTRSVLYGWLNGTSNPSLEYLVKLADYFGCSSDFILGREP